MRLLGYGLAATLWFGPATAPAPVITHRIVKTERATYIVPAAECASTCRAKDRSHTTKEKK